MFERPIAHRGLHDRARGVIENSASAFERAIDHNFAIECDLQLTADGQVVVFHDDGLERLTGLSGLIADVDWGTLAATPLLGSAANDRPQQFDDFLAQIAGRTLLQIELKQQQGAATEMLARKAAAAVASYQGPLMFESFDPRQISLVRDFGFDGPRGIITYGYDNPDWDTGLSDAERRSRRTLDHAGVTQFDFISCFQKDVGIAAVRAWRAKGKPLTAWTIHSRQEAAAIAADVDQIVFEGFDPDRD